MTPVTRKVRVKVPATSANLGSGFDTVGLALDYHDELEFTLSADPVNTAAQVMIEGEGEDTLPRDETHLVVSTFRRACQTFGLGRVGFILQAHNNIPQARGMGSSAEAIVAGIAAAAAFAQDDDLNRDAVFELAAAIEGHPDNVAPALLGGLTSSVFEDGKVYSVKRNVDETLCFAAIVPDYKLLTEAARAALPKEVSHKDAVYNLSRAALVPAAFCEGRHDLLAIATEDKLHQPYRMPLMPGSKEVFDMARLCGAKAVYVSGAGSTVMAVAEKADAEKFYTKLEKGLELLEGLDGCEAFTLLRLDADNTGATVE